MPAEAVDFHLIFDSLPTPHLILSPALVVEAVNEAMCRVLHRPAAELVGRDGLTILPASATGPEHTATLWRTALLHVLERRETRTLDIQRYDIMRSSGAVSTQYWQATLRPVLQQGQLRNIVCRVLDVTDQVLVQEQGNFSRESFSLLTQATHDAIWDADLRTGAVWRNEMFTALFGHPVQASGTSQLWLDHLHPDDRAAVEAQRAAAFAGPDSVITNDYRFRRADGSWAEVLDRAYIVRDAEGRAVRLLGAMQDVTQQRQAERLAQQNAARFQVLAEVQQQLIWTTDAAGEVDYINPFWEQYLHSSLDDARQNGWQHHAHPDDFSTVRALRQQCVESGEPFEREVRLREAASGEYRWFLARAVPALDAQGRIVHWVGSATDIHHQKNTEQFLQQTISQLDRLLESLPQMAWTSRPDGGVTYYNQRWFDFTGGSMAELQEWGWERFIHPEDLPTTLASWKQALAAGTRFEAEHRWRNLRGEYRWFLARAEPIQDEAGNIILWVGTNTDIEESRQMRDQMQQKDRLLRRIMGQIPANIATLLGPDHRIGFVNDGMQRLYGSRAVSGLKIAEAFPEVEEQGFVALMDQVYHSGQAYYGTEQVTLIENEQTGQPETHYLDFTYQPLLDENNTVQGILIFAVEATERVLARRRAQALDAAVRLRDEEMRTMTEALPLITYISDPQGQPLYMSPQWFAYTGHDPNDPDPHAWEQAFHPEDIVRPSFLEAAAQKNVWYQELRLRRHDGQYRWHLSRAVPALDAQGNVLRWFGSSTDIHEQKQIQASLRWSEERYELAALATDDAIWDWDLLTDELTWTPAIERVLGYTAAEMEAVVSWWGARIHPDDAERVLAGIHHAIDHGHTDWQDEYRFRRADGTYAQVFDRGHVARDAGGRAVRMIGAMQDVTQQRQAAAALSQREEEFTALANSMPQLAWMAHADGHIYWYNERWYAYTGTTLEDMQGWDWQKVHHPDYLADVLESWRAALATGEPWKDTFPLRSHDGEYRWFLSRAQPIRNAQGAIVRWIGTNTDVTETQRVQQQLKQQNNELRRINEDLDNFVYTASHDLKQPINNMAGIFEELTRTAYFRDPDAIKLIAMFERALHQIYDTIYNLSELVQVQKLRHELPTETVQLEALTREVLSSIGEQLANVRAIVTTDFDPAPAVEFVRPNLQSVLYNLISNALKYATPKRTPRIHISSTRADDHVVIAVRDNGLGIDMERYGNQLFQMFRRFHDHVAGSGMGLYLVNRIVQSYGGRIEVTSELGKGSTFRIHIPLTGHPLAPAPDEQLMLI
ncbi:PAS domain-containing sensor histidine kinase [Hymenobacter chitinivorans]|uniref:histidine kinase n=1 Tax=Hymenobacter chitinivorans DSM 11115 TaxID=1121954 RepID=A0A2M9B901_9BACT|nr:PAS domain-containing protein [Hymenobacter chitinivorans]PJJ54426.1 PAS domain S-box-containing protein [Hymenobacter chitinivorans DSM 11115]